MDRARRGAVRTGATVGLLGVLVAAGLLRPGQARAAWDKAAFDGKSTDDVLRALGLVGPVPFASIQLEAPEIAENGAVVPVKVATDLPGVDRIAVIVEKNPMMLSAVFMLPEGTEPQVTTRVKMAETSRVIVAVRAGGKVYTASKEVKVTLGGCGG